jgi:hypothetical protein
MDQRLKIVADRISAFFREIHFEATSHSFLGRLACIRFKVNGQEHEILLERSPELIVMGELKGRKAIQDDDLEGFNILIQVEDFGPLGRENGLCRIRVYNCGESDNLLDIHNPEAAKYVNSEKLVECDLDLADKAIDFLKNFLRESFK